MSCRKYEAPRHGSLAFVPRKRVSKMRQAIRAFPKDDPTKPVHLTGFLAYKSGMTHVVRVSTRARGLDKKSRNMMREVFDAVTIVEAPPVVVFGVVGYKKTLQGLKHVGTIIAQHVNEGVLRRYHAKNYKTEKKPFSHYAEKYANGQIKDTLEVLKKESDIVRVLIHSQVEKIPSLKTKRAHILEVQLNGGTVLNKLEWAIDHFEKEISVKDVFSPQELLDIIGVTKGKGFQGCTKRYGTTILPRKTNKGRRKVACIGAWHPSRVLYSVPRAGQLGCHRRTMINKKIYMIGNGREEIKTEFDLTSKGINPMGAFPHYGLVNNDFLMIKGGVTGPVKRVLTLRKSLIKQWNKKNTEEITLKFIDTSSKIGHGRFQTPEEKKAYYGALKKDLVTNE